MFERFGERKIIAAEIVAEIVSERRIGAAARSIPRLVRSDSGDMADKHPEHPAPTAPRQAAPASAAAVSSQDESALDAQVAEMSA